MALAAVGLVYVAILELGYAQFGPRLLTLSAVPVITAAGLFGSRAGLLAGVIAVLLNAILAGPQALLYLPGALEATIGILIAGPAVGGVRELTLALLEERSRLRDEVRERNAAERVAWQAQQRLRQVIDSVPVIVLATDQQGKVVLVEGRGAGPTARAQLLGRSLFERYAWRSDIVAAIGAALNGDESTSNWTVDGREFVASSAPLRDAEGQITGIIVVAFDTTAQRKAERALEHLRSHDALTGLPDRGTLEEDLGRSLAEAPEDLLPLALLVLDIDDLKEMNDAYGYAIGDELLKHVAGRLRASVPVGAVLGRLDGDAFGLLLYHADGLRAHAVALQMLQCFEEPVVTRAGPLRVAAAVGIACFPADGADADTLLRRADIALDLARAAGSRLATYAPERDAYRLDRRRFVAELRQAVDAGDLLLHYQPIVTMSDGEVAGVEALVRWPHPTRGLVPPLDFIELAERSGVIRALTRWVIRTALADIRSSGHTELQVSVNLSPANLLDADFAEFIAGEMAADAAGPRLRLEVTESALMADPTRAAAVLTELRKLGISIAIDDFGTGYSSLAYLQRLPVDEIKIDRTFIRAMSLSDRSTAIVRATVELAHALQLRVVGEGVEDEQAWLALKSLGCELAQGYHIARPMPLSELSEWLDRR